MFDLLLKQYAGSFKPADAIFLLHFLSFSLSMDILPYFVLVSFTARRTLIF